MKQTKPRLIVIILTYNSEQTVARVINSVKGLATKIIVVDDMSKDNSVKIAKELGCKVVRHKFEDYSKQRNWAQEYTKLRSSDWVLHLDSDEVVSKGLYKSIRMVKSSGITRRYKCNAFN